VDVLAINYIGSIVCSENNVVEDVIEGSVYDPESIGCRTFKFRISTRLCGSIRRNSSNRCPSISLLGEHNEFLIFALGQTCLDLGIVDNPESSESELNIVKG
jgi:hypothetical protein